MKDSWNDADSYEYYVGRWSRLTAIEFLKWLDVKVGKDWLDVGCGTGALTSAILEISDPGSVIGLDTSEFQVDYAKETIRDKRGEFKLSEAENLSIVPDNSIDVLVSGLVLNFIPDINNAILEFKRAAKDRGLIAGYVWDYSGKMELMRYFWDTAVRLFEDAGEKTESSRFDICNPDSLADLFESAGLRNIGTKFIDVPTVFRNFDDYWNPFLTGIGPAPGYCMSLTDEKRELLRNELYSSLPVESDGRIKLIARAIAIKAENHK
jgi:ubiquinone/menaquinone biosynthesis C-methylase UbiE